MIDVLTDRPVKPKKALSMKAPSLYRIEAWSPGDFCSGKFTRVAYEVFELPIGVSIQLSKIIHSTHRALIADGLSADVAASKAQHATSKMTEYVGDCPCNSRLKFIAIEDI